MIECTELMYGDWVFAPSRTPSQVISVNESQVILREPGVVGFTVANIKNITPIPLTREVVEQIEGEIDNSIFEAPRKYLALSREHPTDGGSLTAYFHYNESDDTFPVFLSIHEKDCMDFHKRVRYLHATQNLLRVNAGIELKLKNEELTIKSKLKHNVSDKQTYTVLGRGMGKTFGPIRTPRIDHE